MAKEMERTIKQRTLEGKFGPGSSPRAETYTREYAKRTGKAISPVTMRLSNRMMDSLEGAFQTRKSGLVSAFIRFSNSEARWLANIHEHEEAPPKGLPRRIFLWFDEDDQRRIINIGLRAAMKAQKKGL